MTTCAHCHEPFTPKRRTARYCGDACRVAAHRGTPPERGTDHRSGATGAVLALRPTQVAKEPALAPKALPVTLREPISRPHKLPSGAILVSVRETEERAGQFEAWVADQLTTLPRRCWPQRGFYWRKARTRRPRSSCGTTGTTSTP